MHLTTTFLAKMGIQKVKTVESITITVASYGALGPKLPKQALKEGR